MTFSYVSARTADGAGGFTDVPTNMSPATAWVAVRPADARDVARLFGAKVQVPISHIVEARYHSDLQAKLLAGKQCKGVWNARTFAIRGWQNPDERNRTLFLACEEYMAA